MKVGDLVSTKSKNVIGVIIDSKTLVNTRGLSTDQVRLRGRDVNSHQVYWSHPGVEKNPAWVKERFLVKAV